MKITNKFEPILKKNSTRKKEKTQNTGGIRSYYHYAFPVLIAILLFYFFTQYLFNQVKQSSYFILDKNKTSF